MATTRQQIDRTRDNGRKKQSASQATRTAPEGGRGGRRAGGARPGGRQDESVWQESGLKSINGERLARGLGWFSLGLGLAELLAPRAINKIAGGRGRRTGLIRLLGLREIAHGVAIFAQGRKPAAAVWSRVAGDAIDLACLGAAFASPQTGKGRAAFATANVLTVTALDLLCVRQLSRGDGAAAEGGAVRVKQTAIVNRPPAEVYRYWHDFQNLPGFMHHLESVRVTGEGRSHWTAKAPAGMTVEWDAEITEDRPDELIAWRSLAGADVDNSGSVRFEPAPGNRGTLVTVELEYDPPGGVVGAAAARLFGEEPNQQVKSDLRRFKQVLETGEVMLSDGSLYGTGLTEQRPGQPPAQP